MSAAGIEAVTLPAGPVFFDRLAALLLDRHGDGLAACDLVIPNLIHAPAVRSALSAAAGCALFMPRLLTPSTLAMRWMGDQPVDADSRRLLRLVGHLRQQAWLGEGDPWAMARELIDLADALADIAAPDDAHRVERIFEHSHALHDSAALSLEARLVHAVWLADCTGTPGHARARAQALLRAANHASRPLIHVCDGREPCPAWLDAYAVRAPVLLVRAAREAEPTPLVRVLEAAWPVGDDARPSSDRVPEVEDARLLRDRIRLVSAQSLEQEARYAAACIAGWLADGRRNIALVATDREAARRTRALLERHHVLLADETGWKLSTTRAAATVDAFLQCIASNGYHRDLLDLIRSPYVSGGLDADMQARAIRLIDDWVVRRNHVDGLQALLEDASRDFEGMPAGILVDALSRAASLMPTQNAPAAFWVERLLAALDALQARAALMQDAAGAQVVALLEQLRADSAGILLLLSFSDWRQWLNSELEQGLFRDVAIDSPVVLTHLAATRLRTFDAAYVIGADRQHLVPPRLRGVLGHDGLKRELGLPDAQCAATQLRDDLAGLICCSGEVVFSWQAQRNGEANLPGIDLQRLDLMLRRAGLPGAVVAASTPTEARPLVLPALTSAPTLDRMRVPARLTASALSDLMACPYRYYARHVLGLGAGDEVEETLGKGSVGELVHRVLHDFHRAHSSLSIVPFDTLVDDMKARIAAAFEHAIARNFQAHSWADRLLARAGSYVAWARQREAEGWRFDSGEQKRARPLELPDGALLSLEGRIDRLDHGASGWSLLDYKLRTAKRVKDSLAAGDDLQLSFYALLEGEGVTETAYLALDEDVPAVFPQPDPQASAHALQVLVSDVFPALHAGAPLPAHGDESACRYCEMRGLCRKDWLR